MGSSTVEAARQDRHRDPLEMLKDAVRLCPVPTTPIVQTRNVEERGLGLLELAARLDHITRRSEDLNQIDKHHLERAFSLDIDLSRLAERHFRALEDTGMSAVLSRRSASNESHSAASGAGIWIPIASQTRRDLASILVHDNEGAVLPRMSSEDVAAAHAAGLIKLFRMLLDTARDTHRTDPLYRLRHDSHRSRWLIEQAVKTLVYQGSPNEQWLGASGDVNGSSTEATSVRRQALSAIDALAAQTGPSFRSYLELLASATLAYPVVVLLPTTPGPVFVRFEAPPIPGETPTTRIRHVVATLARATSPVRVYQHSYSTQAPRGSSSYHLSLEVAKQLRVRRLVVATDVDEPAIESLIRDIRGVADRYDELREAAEKLLENELQSIAEKLSLVARRRASDAEGYRRYLERTGAGTGSWPKVASQRSASQIIDDFIGGDHHPLQPLMEFAAGLYDGRFTKLVGVLTSDRLVSMAERISRLELGKAVLYDNDPRDNAGHVYWHQANDHGEADSVEPMRVFVHAVVLDDPPSLAGSVRRMMAALLGVLVLTFTVSTSGIAWLAPWLNRRLEISQQDAVVTVLLLVPGLLLTRLDIPETRSVLGQVRYQSRFLAFSSVAVFAALAAYIAIAEDPRTFAASISVVLMLVLIMINLIGDLATWRDGKESASRSRAIPEWLRKEFPERPSSRLRPPLTQFRSTTEAGRAL